MAVTLEDNARNAMMDALDALLAGGDIRFETAASNPVATCGFGTPAFGDASAGSITANAISDDTNASAGTITKAILRTSAAAAVMEMSVTATGGGGDIELSSVAIGDGDTISVTSLVLTLPAS